MPAIRKRKPAAKSGSDSESSSSSSSSSDDDDSSSSSSEDDEAVSNKPAFVPKHKRGLLIANNNNNTTAHSAREVEELEEEQRQQKKKARLEKRKKESRALVQQVVAATSGIVENDGINQDSDSELLANLGPMPDDADEVEDEENKVVVLAASRNAWEVRELVRLLVDYDILQAAKQEAAELARRRKMTDEERLQEEIAAGRYQKPGQARQQQLQQANDKNSGGGGGGGPQRFFHRGAYYMDQDEWEQDGKDGNKKDIRFKAADYAKTATAADRMMNSAALPDVMKVKQFGRANQNLKYKGLVKEDTTDRQAQAVLPLHQHQSKQSTQKKKSIRPER